MADIVALAYPQDADRVLDLCLRGRDYVALETGKGPDAAYAREVLTETPPGIPPDQIWSWGHADANATLDGVATCLKGFYGDDEWYLGLLLVDPAARGTGLGAKLARHVIAQARDDNALCLRVAVLDTNPRARTFWERLRFSYEKSSTGGDGNLRHVLRLDLTKKEQTA